MKSLVLSFFLLAQAAVAGEFSFLGQSGQIGLGPTLGSPHYEIGTLYFSESGETACPGCHAEFMSGGLVAYQETADSQFCLFGAGGSISVFSGTALLAQGIFLPLNLDDLVWTAGAGKLGLIPRQGTALVVQRFLGSLLRVDALIQWYRLDSSLGELVQRTERLSGFGLRSSTTPLDFLWLSGTNTRTVVREAPGRLGRSAGGLVPRADAWLWSGQGPRLQVRAPGPPCRVHGPGCP